MRCTHDGERHKRGPPIRGRYCRQRDRPTPLRIARVHLEDPRRAALSFTSSHCASVIESASLTTTQSLHQTDSSIRVKHDAVRTDRSSSVIRHTGALTTCSLFQPLELNNATHVEIFTIGACNGRPTTQLAVVRASPETAPDHSAARLRTILRAQAGTRRMSRLGVTPNQRERRARIVTEALLLAGKGYDAVHIREVAYRADVARGTVYRYFPSKDQLLIACLLRWLEQYDLRDDIERVDLEDPYERLLSFVEHLNTKLCATPKFADAVARAYRVADAAAAPDVEAVRVQLIAMMADAMATDVPTQHNREVAELITDVWAANILAFAHRRATLAQLQHRLALAIDLIRNRFTVGRGM